MTRLVLVGLALTLAASCFGDDDAPSGVSTVTAVAPTDASATPPPSPSEPPPAASAPASELALAEWAAEFCAIAATLQDALASARGDVDKTTLSLEERIERGHSLYAAYLSALDRSLFDLIAMRPPTDVADYHRATIVEMATVTREINRQSVLPDRTSHEAFEVLNAQLSIVAAEAAVKPDAELENLSIAAFAALDGVTQCGPP